MIKQNEFGFHKGYESFSDEDSNPFAMLRHVGWRLSNYHVFIGEEDLNFEGQAVILGLRDLEDKTKRHRILGSQEHCYANFKLVDFLFSMAFTPNLEITNLPN
jgi:hypothetical protein